MNVNQAAFCTTTVLAAATIAASIAAATAITTIATIAYATLATVGAAFSIASITGWIAASDQSEDTASAYFEKFSGHIGYALVGVTQFVAQTLFVSIIDGFARGLSDRVYKKIA